MDAECQELYYMKLDELIQDENNIITWNSAAASLKISPKESAELLVKYLTDHRQLKPNKLSASYIITGILKGDKKYGIVCVAEDNLEEVKKQYENIISERVYSIQKTKNINFDALSLIDQEPVDDLPKSGLIIGKKCIKRDIKKKITPAAAPAISKTAGPAKPSTSFFSKQLPKSETNEVKLKVESESSKSKEENRKPAQIKQTSKKGSLANFFSQSSAKSKSQTTKIESVKSEKSDESEKLLEDMPIKDESDSENQPQNKRKNVKKPQKDMKMEVDEPEPKPKKDEKNNKRRKKKQKNSEMPNKKRKRIQEMDDSDSSDIFENDEDNEEDIIDKSYDEPEPPPKLLPPAKKKTKKAVDRTYVDDEGFIVTKTEYVFESGSEEEKEKEVMVVKKEERKEVELEQKKKKFEKKMSTTDSESDIKTAETKKGKKNSKKDIGKNQPTLMNFFKKV